MSSLVRTRERLSIKSRKEKKKKKEWISFLPTVDTTSKCPLAGRWSLVSPRRAPCQLPIGRKDASFSVLVILLPSCVGYYFPTGPHVPFSFNCFLSFFFFLIQKFVFLSIDRNTGCECVEYTSTFGQVYGQFTSPDFPKPYDPGIGCVLYTFTAPLPPPQSDSIASTWIVELTITHLNLPPTIT